MRTDLGGDLRSHLPLPGCSLRYLTVVSSERDQPYFRKRNNICSRQIATALPQNNVVRGENAVTVMHELCEGALASWLHLRKVLCPLKSVQGHPTQSQALVVVYLQPHVLPQTVSPCWVGAASPKHRSLLRAEPPLPSSLEYTRQFYKAA